jgi:hypothetical protein
VIHVILKRKQISKDEEKEKRELVEDDDALGWMMMINK